MNRVVITGIGMVTPLGNDTPTTWQRLLDRHNAVNTITQFDAGGLPTSIAAEVKGFCLSRSVPTKLARQAVRFGKFALQAAQEALNDAAIRPTDQSASRWGLIVGSGMMTSEFDYWTRFQPRYAPLGRPEYERFGVPSGEFLSVADFSRTQGNGSLALLAQHYNIQGYTSSVHTACASGGQALGLALNVIRRGDADYVLAGGFDSMVNPTGVSSFCLLGALSKENDHPETASKPFDYERQGFVLGEGAGFLVLERLERAKARGAPIYAELAGEGNSLSAYRITDSPPSGDGPIQAIEQALADAGERPEAVDYINAHGTGTKMNDLSETNAIKKALGQHAYAIPISSTKSQIGHLIAGAGAVEAGFTALTIKHGRIPMTMNYNTPDPECDLDYVTDKPREQTISVALSNSFGFGGSNSCLCLKHVEAH